MDWKPRLLIEKDADAVLDWRWDYSDAGWLSTGDIIASHSVSADAGITVQSDEHDDTGVRVWLAGGTAGVTYTVTVRVTTAQGRVDEHGVDFRVTVK